MAIELPASVEIVQTPRGTLWRLPQIESRTLGGFVVVFFMAALWWGVLSVFLYQLFSGFLNQNHDLSSLLFRIGMGIFLLPFIGVGLLLLLIVHCYWARQRTEITIGEDYLYYTRGSGYLVQTEKREKSMIRGVKVAVEKKSVKMFSTSGSNSELRRRMEERQKNESPKEAVFVSAEGAKRDLVIASGYSREILVPLARALAEACAADTTSVLSADPKDNALRVEIDPPPPAPAEIAAGAAPEPLLEKPASSKAIMVDDGTNATFIFPARGFFKNSGLLIFGVLWLVFVNFVFYQMFFHHADQRLELLPAILFPLLFEGAGLVMILAAIHNARKKAVLIASKSELLFSQVSPFRTSEKRWDVANIKDITWGASGAEVNNVPLMQLQIITRDGKNHGLLTGRDSDELAWLAQELHRATYLRVAGSSTATSV